MDLDPLRQRASQTSQIASCRDDFDLSQQCMLMSSSVDVAPAVSPMKLLDMTSLSELICIAGLRLDASKALHGQGEGGVSRARVLSQEGVSMAREENS